MEYYKDSKTIIIQPNITLDLGSSEYNHKALLILPLIDIANPDIRIFTYSKNSISTIPLTVRPFQTGGDSRVLNFYNGLIQIRAAKIQNMDSIESVQCLLLN